MREAKKEKKKQGRKEDKKNENLISWTYIICHSYLSFGAFPSRSTEGGTLRHTGVEPADVLFCSSVLYNHSAVLFPSFKLHFMFDDLQRWLWEGREL